MSSCGPSPTQEGIARNAAGLVNEGRGGRPVGIVKHGGRTTTPGYVHTCLGVPMTILPSQNTRLNNREAFAIPPARCPPCRVVPPRY